MANKPRPGGAFTDQTSDEPNTNPAGQDGTENFWGRLFSDPQLSLELARADVQIELKEFEKYHSDPKDGLAKWLEDWQGIIETHVYTDQRRLLHDAKQTIHEAIENDLTFLQYAAAFLAEALDLKYSVVLLAQDSKRHQMVHNTATGQNTVIFCTLIQDMLFGFQAFKSVRSKTLVLTPAEMARGILNKAQIKKAHPNLARDLLNSTIPKYVKFSRPVIHPGPIKPVKPSGDFSWLFLVLRIAAFAGVLAMR